MPVVPGVRGVSEREAAVSNFTGQHTNGNPHLQVAAKKHVCSECGKEIPVGHKYWRQYTDDFDNKVHTNCLDYEKRS